MYYKQLKECKNKKDVVERLKRTANIVGEGSMFTKKDEFIENLTYGELSKMISVEIKRVLSLQKSMEEIENGTIDENNEEFDIDEFMKELKTTMNDDIDDDLRDKDDESLDELIRELEDEILIEGFKNENKFVQ